MIKTLAWTLLLLLLSAVPAEAAAEDLSRYPCSVFSYTVCLRLPTGVEVKYSVPADFDVYTFSKNDRTFASMYVGSAPQDAETQPVKVIELENGSLSIHHQIQEGAQEIEFYFLPNGRATETVHIWARPAPDTLLELAELLSSFRPCKPLRAGGQRCVENDLWSREMVSYLDTIK